MKNRPEPEPLAPGIFKVCSLHSEIFHSVPFPLGNIGGVEWGHVEGFWEE